MNMVRHVDSQWFELISQEKETEIYNSSLPTMIVVCYYYSHQGSPHPTMQLSSKSFPLSSPRMFILSKSLHPMNGYLQHRKCKTEEDGHPNHSHTLVCNFSIIVHYWDFFDRIHLLGKANLDIDWGILELGGSTTFVRSKRIASDKLNVTTVIPSKFYRNRPRNGDGFACAVQKQVGRHLMTLQLHSYSAHTACMWSLESQLDHPWWRPTFVSLESHSG